MSSKLKNAKTAPKKPTVSPPRPAITQEQITNDTPMGATLTANGATFRV